MTIKTLAAAFALTLASAPALALKLGVTSLDFGDQSMNTTSPAQTVTITNAGVVPVDVASMAADANFAVTHNCVSLTAGASCAASVTFTPSNPSSINGSLTIVSADGSQTVSLAGRGEKSLATHYYRAILRRAADTAGKTYWESEAARLVPMGVDVNETWFAMAMQFFGGTEYAAFKRDDIGYITDLYTTFFNRAPDAGGLAYWNGLMSSGMPREVVLASFMFSPEFGSFTEGIFGKAASRAETNVVMDFYRGLLGRLPDSGGLIYWLAQFRAAQCQGESGVVSQAEAISSAYALSPEYIARNRTDAQFVGDLYNAFLRRGGDLAGVQFWIGELGAGRRTRERIRRDFIAQPEFQARVAAVIAQGCQNTLPGNFSFTSAHAVSGPNTDGVVTIQRAGGSSGAFDVIYSYEGFGCGRSDTGIAKFADGETSKALKIPMAASGQCTVNLKQPAAPARLVLPVGTVITVVPVVAGCATPSNVTPAAIRGIGQPLLQMQASGQTVFMPLPSPTVGVSGQITFSESAGGAYTPQPVTLEISISKCPGIIGTNAADFCNLRTTNGNYNSITYLTKASSFINAGNAAQYGYCWAGDSGPFYVNARWSYNSCAFGASICGFAVQYNNGPF